MSTPCAAASSDEDEPRLASEELRQTLASAGIVLPSLRADPLSCAGWPPLDLVELGRCNVATARALAEVVRRGRGEVERDGS